MEAVNARVRRTDDMQIRKALLPTLSIAKPRNGLDAAEIMYGRPKR
jgi:hypothetical protein